MCVLRYPKWVALFAYIQYGIGPSAALQLNFGVARSEALRRVWRMTVEPRPSQSLRACHPYTKNPKIKL